MTTIVAVRDGKRTWIGLDTQGTRGSLRLVCGPKWVRHGAWAVGHAGDLRVLNIMRHHAKRLLDDLEGPFEFTGRLMDILNECDFKLSPHGNNHAPCTGQDFILANPAVMWRICSSSGFAPNEDFWADGSGQDFALGAMYANRAMRGTDDAERILRVALGAAMTFDTLTGGEVWVEVLE